MRFILKCLDLLADNNQKKNSVYVWLWRYLCFCVSTHLFVDLQVLLTQSDYPRYLFWMSKNLFTYTVFIWRHPEGIAMAILPWEGICPPIRIWEDYLLQVLFIRIWGHLPPAGTFHFILRAMTAYEMDNVNTQRPYQRQLSPALCVLQTYFRISL